MSGLRDSPLRVTYYVALPFVPDDHWDLVPDEAKDRQTAGAAVLEAQRMAATAAGAVAFEKRRTATGDFEDVVVIRSFGTVPSLDDLMTTG